MCDLGRTTTDVVLMEVPGRDRVLGSRRRHHSFTCRRSRSTRWRCLGTSCLWRSSCRCVISALCAPPCLLNPVNQDPVYHVRMTFLDKLVSFLSRRRIHPMYNIVPFLCVHDPEHDVKTKASAVVIIYSMSLSLMPGTQAQAYVKFALKALPKGRYSHRYLSDSNTEVRRYRQLSGSRPLSTTSSGYCTCLPIIQISKSMRNRSPTWQG